MSEVADISAWRETDRWDFMRGTLDEYQNGGHRSREYVFQALSGEYDDYVVAGRMYMAMWMRGTNESRS